MLMDKLTKAATGRYATSDNFASRVLAKEMLIATTATTGIKLFTSQEAQ
jgi:hypothetical protein